MTLDKSGRGVHGTRELVRVLRAVLLSSLGSQAIALNVDDFGARGDGMTWDHSAIQAAINAAGAGGIVEFTAGRTYVQCAQITPLPRQTLRGNLATLRRCDAPVARLVADVQAGATVLVVDDASAFRVNQSITPVKAAGGYPDGEYVLNHFIRAIDVDGEISASIAIAGREAIDTSRPGTFHVTYDVSDSAANAAATRTRVVRIVDSVPPVIELAGSPHLRIPVGAPYVEPGVTARDNVDGDLSADINIDTGGLDLTRPGRYFVIYRVGDLSGNTAEVERTIIVDAPASGSGAFGAAWLAGLLALWLRRIGGRFSRHFCRKSSRERTVLGYDLRMKNAAFVLASMFAGVTLAGCGGDESEPENLRIYHDPYRGVDWVSDVRLKGQHHDHIGLNTERIAAYDAAGYAVLGLIDYSGLPSAPFALKRRLWPVESELPEAFLATLANIRVWFSSAEEIGIATTHVDSPFMTQYIERWDTSVSPAKQPWHYESEAELFRLIRANGGLPILAHPWGQGQRYAAIDALFGAEIYSAFAEARRREGLPDFTSVDRNQVLLENWDAALASNQSVIGIAVNDHYGPYASGTDADIRDSGKIIVLAKAATLDAYRDAFSRGAVLAIRDSGRTKDRYPSITSIVVGATEARITTDGDVSWIATSRVIAQGPLLPYTTLPSGSRYVRAQVRNAEGSIVFTQAFWVRPVGDADGNGLVDAEDRRICEAVAAGADMDPDRSSACRP